MCFQVEDVVALIPFSKSVRTVNLTATQGSVLFDEATKVAKWTVGKLGSDKRPILTGTIFRNAPGVQGGIPTASGATATDATEVCCVLPIQLTWKVPTASVSGLAIASLQLTNEVYKPFKGMRTQTQSGKFLIRCTY
jgi:AP-3 complex subunit mu